MRQFSIRLSVFIFLMAGFILFSGCGDDNGVNSARYTPGDELNSLPLCNSFDLFVIGNPNKISDQLPAAYGISACFGEPDSSMVNALLSLPLTADYKVSFMSERGEVLETGSGNLEAGVHIWQVSTNDLDAGIYGFYFEAGDYSSIYWFEL